MVDWAIFDQNKKVKKWGVRRGGGAQPHFWTDELFLFRTYFVDIKPNISWLASLANISQS